MKEGYKTSIASTPRPQAVGGPILTGTDENAVVLFYFCELLLME